MRVALYGRVSTTEQNAAMQIEELRAYCVRRQWEIAEEFIDAGVSGSKESRPALNRLLAEAKRRKFGAVLVYRYDRFARSLRQLVNALAEFDALGIHFVSLHEGVDTSTPNGRLVFGIFASIAEFERELIRGRVRSGLAAARARGKRLGRPRVIVDAATIAVLRTQGLSWAKIGEQLGVWRGYGLSHRACVRQKPAQTGACNSYRISGRLMSYRGRQNHQLVEGEEHRGLRT
jgi:DNA invertase Pin-like site-specific DNA recombinase